MAKKSRKRRKQRKTNVPQYTPPTESQETAEAELVAAAPVAVAATTSKASFTGAGINAIDWRAEYPFVVGDLRSMAIVAALMLALLLGLNLFLA